MRDLRGIFNSVDDFKFYLYSNNIILNVFKFCFRFIFIGIFIRLGLFLFLVEYYSDFVSFIISLLNWDYVSVLSERPGTFHILFEHVQLTFSAIELFSVIFFLYLLEFIFFFSLWRSVGKFSVIKGKAFLFNLWLILILHCFIFLHGLHWDTLLSNSQTYFWQFFLNNVSSHVGVGYEMGDPIGMVYDPNFWVILETFGYFMVLILNIGPINFKLGFVLYSVFLAI